jgi:hypothetical protein
MEAEAAKKTTTGQAKKAVAEKSTDAGAKYVKKKAPGRGEVEILAETYDNGKPEGEDAGRWRQKLESREEKLKYLQTGERYWYSEDWFGSEKRKNPA